MSEGLGKLSLEMQALASSTTSFEPPGATGGNRKGAPSRQERKELVNDTRRTLSYLQVRGTQRSGVTGKAPTNLVLALMVWFEDSRSEHAGIRPSAWKPPTPVGVNLMAMRRDAIRTVSGKLIARANEHVARARAGETVHALRMTNPDAHGAYTVRNLPGVYSHDWPTPIGLDGETSIEETHEAVAGGTFELLTLTLDEADAALVALKARLRARCEQADSNPWRLLGEPDEAAIWEEVARTARLRSRGGHGDWGGEVKIKRLLKDIKTFEYQHPGMEDVTGRRPLPAVRPEKEAADDRRLRWLLRNPSSIHWRADNHGTIRWTGLQNRCKESDIHRLLECDLLIPEPDGTVTGR